MRRLFAVTFLFSLIAMPAAGQVVCTQLGAFTDCSGPNNRSQTQVDLGNHQGVIIGDRTTTPYTILTPPAPSVGVPSLKPLPMLEPLPTLGGTTPAPPSTPLFVPGADGPILMLGQ
ncbi:MAG: hypothetical protein OJF52_003714 [Nitrospira sp.]|jgi:hypothetical protein|nr:MAG: hypothetical protein OJF52_003714 [Nitrospira sp.]